jgi:hypothetical protein
MMLKLMAISPALSSTPTDPGRVELDVLHPRPLAQFHGKSFHRLGAFVGHGKHEGIGKRIRRKGFDHLAQSRVGLHPRQCLFTRQKLKPLDVAALLQARFDFGRHPAIGVRRHEN